MSTPILQVEDLRVHFSRRHGMPWNRRTDVNRAVDGISFHVERGETFGLVGESGCGKSTTARAILNLLPVTGGEVRWLDKRIDGFDETQMWPYRRQLQMIFQDPFASLNPRMTVGRIIGEPMQIYNIGKPEHRKLEVMRLMDLVGLNPRFLNRYPHEFSGGQRQRIGIARALAVDPQLIFCDEPVSALDVSIQAQVINLLMQLKRDLDLAYVFIAHDLSVVRHISDRIGVMYLGRLVEVAPADRLYEDPRHPYTKALLAAIPIPDPVAERARQHAIIEGEASLDDETVGTGCPFAPRCPKVMPKCRENCPTLEGDKLHQVACFACR